MLQKISSLLFTEEKADDSANPRQTTTQPENLARSKGSLNGGADLERGNSFNHNYVNAHQNNNNFHDNGSNQRLNGSNRYMVNVDESRFDSPHDQNEVRRPFSGKPPPSSRAWSRGDADSIHNDLMSSPNVDEYREVGHEKLQQMQFMKERIKQAIGTDRTELELKNNSDDLNFSELPPIPNTAEYRFIRHRTSKKAAEDFLADSPHCTYLVRHLRPNATDALELQDLVLSVHEQETPETEFSDKTAEVTVKFSKYRHIPLQVCVGSGRRQTFTLSHDFSVEQDEGFRCFSTLADLLVFYSNNPYKDDDKLEIMYGEAKSFKTSQPNERIQGQKPESQTSKPELQGPVPKPFYCTSEFFAVCLIVFYFALGISYYASLEGWTPLQAAYFTVVVATTIGYGDNSAIDLKDVQIFSSFYVLFGVAVVFSSVMILVEFIEKKAKAKSKEATKQAITSKFNPNSVTKEVVITKISMPNRIKLVWKQHSLLRASVIWSGVVLVGMLFVTNYAIKLDSKVDPYLNSTSANKTLADGDDGDDDNAIPFSRPLRWEEAFYWAVVTGTTVGFGDISLQTEGAQAFAIIYLWVIVAATGILLPEISSLIKGGGGDLSKMLNRDLDEDLIREFDISGDGEVDKGEWLRAFLVALGYVDGDLCDIILSQFDMLDVSGDGNLSIEDILLATQKTPGNDARRQSIEQNQQAANNWQLNNSGGGGHGIQVGARRLPINRPSRSDLL